MIGYEDIRRAERYLDEGNCWLKGFLNLSVEGDMREVGIAIDCLKGALLFGEEGGEEIRRARVNFDRRMDEYVEKTKGEESGGGNEELQEGEK